LPIEVTREKDGSFKLEPSRSMLYPAIFKLREKGIFSFTWVGFPGIYPKNEDEENQIKVLLAKERCFPVFFEKTLIDKF